MPTIDDAILVIREAVQNSDDPHASIGKPTALDQVEWIGTLLGWKWPRSYLEILSKHDGADVGFATIPDFFSAFRTFLVLRHSWHPHQYWPLAQDGCGNYWVMALKESRDGDCPVHFLDHETETGLEAPDHTASNSISAFLVEYFTKITT